MSLDVSVVICTYNGRKLLEPTLAHLAAQRCEGVAWELVLVDNASTDGTADFVRRTWTRGDVPLRVVREPELGLHHARFAGTEAALGDLVIYVDDDNWLAPDYVTLAIDTMRAHPDVGACGGKSSAAFEKNKPAWIDPFLPALAVGEQCYPDGRVHEALWGAGLIIRREAWRQIVGDGFRFSVGRRGTKSLGCGCDNELCAAIAARGWKMHYEPRLKWEHFMPSARLTWEYMRRIFRGRGTSSVALDPGGADRLSSIERTWAWRFAWETHVLLQRSRLAPRWLLKSPVGDADFLALEEQLGRWSALWRARGPRLVGPPIRARRP